MKKFGATINFFYKSCKIAEKISTISFVFYGLSGGNLEHRGIAIYINPDRIVNKKT